MTLNDYIEYLQWKHFSVIHARWFWAVFALVLLVGIFAYAFYCTKMGHSFGGSVRLHSPRYWSMEILCG